MTDQLTDSGSARYYLSVAKINGAAIVGLCVPLGVSSKTLLTYELKRRNVQPHLFPMSCINELAADILARAKLQERMSRQFGRRTSATEALIYRTEDVADRIAEILGIKPVDKGENSLNRDDREALEIVLRRHGLPPAPKRRVAAG